MANIEQRIAPSKPPSTCSTTGAPSNKACAVLRHLNLNLLTATQKTSLRNHLAAVTIRDSLLIIFAEFAVIGSVFLAGRMALERNFRETIEQTTSIARTFSGNNREIQQYNEEVNSIGIIHKDFVPIGDIYGDIISVIPPGVSLSSLDLDFLSKRFKMQGKARSRDDLNALRDTLASVKVLGNLQSPLSNLFVKADIPFEFTADLRTENATVPEFIPRDFGQASSTTSI